jgi:hypothetical protein
MQSGDVIRSIDGQQMRSVEDVQRTIQNKKGGATILLQIARKAPGLLDWEKVTASTTRQLDYTFTTAPVDWYAGKGRWEVAERWTCQPQWGFFAGSNSVNPTLWSRFAVSGDFTLEAYLATPMDLTRGERSPADLNLSIGGDGRDLASGYSFMFSAHNRTNNRLLRGDEVVVNKPFELPPGVGNTHQDWFYVRLERRQTPQGLRFRYSVNGREIINYTDPQPLPSALNRAGRIAFWTYNGGLSIARARLWYSNVESARENEDDNKVNTTLAAAGAPTATLKNAVGEWSARRESVLEATAQYRVVSDDGRRALKITNAQSGGDWTLFATREPFDAVQHPNLRFDYRVPANVKINVYAKVDGRWREIVFTGDLSSSEPGTRPGAAPVRPRPGTIKPPEDESDEEEVDTSLTIGRIGGVSADDKWHTATFDLLGALRKAGLGTKVESLSFAAPDREYLRAGIGGNHWGATYWLSNFQMSANTPQTVAAVP